MQKDDGQAALQSSYSLLFCFLLRSFIVRAARLWIQPAFIEFLAGLSCEDIDGAGVDETLDTVRQCGLQHILSASDIYLIEHERVGQPLLMQPGGMIYNGASLHCMPNNDPVRDVALHKLGYFRQKGFGFVDRADQYLNTPPASQERLDNMVAYEAR